MNGTKNPKGKPPVIVPSMIAKWAAANSTNAYVNSYKVGGGRPAWNGRK
jgi:hypothetical protein